MDDEDKKLWLAVGKHLPGCCDIQSSVEVKLLSKV